MTEDRLDAIASDLQALCDKQAFEIARQREVIETWADIDRKSSARIEVLEKAIRALNERLPDLRVSMSGYSMVCGRGDDRRIVAKSPAPAGPSDKVGPIVARFMDDIFTIQDLVAAATSAVEPDARS